MHSAEHVLRQLIARRAPATIHFRNGKADSHLSVLLVKEGDWEGHPGIWARIPDGGNALVDQLIGTASTVQVKTRDGKRELSFASSILVRRKPLMGEPRSILAWPTTIRIQERRRREREPMSTLTTVTAQLIQGRNGSFPATNTVVQVVDLTTAGACVVCPPLKFAPPQSASPQQAQDLRIKLKFDDIEHDILARHQHTQTLPDGQLQLRIEFVAEDLAANTLDHLANLVERLRGHRFRCELGRAMIRGIH